MKAAQEVRAQWEEKRARQEANYKSFNSLESEESSVASSDAPSEKETRYGKQYSLYYLNTSVMVHGPSMVMTPAHLKKIKKAQNTFQENQENIFDFLESLDFLDFWISLNFLIFLNIFLIFFISLKPRVVMTIDRPWTHFLHFIFINHGSECIPCLLEQGATIIFSFFF